MTTYPPEMVRRNTALNEAAMSEPVFAFMCSECDRKVGDVFDTTVGGLLRAHHRRGRTEVRNNQTGETRLGRRGVMFGSMLDEIGEGPGLPCPKHGNRKLPPSATMLRLLADPPATRVVPI